MREKVARLLETPMSARRLQLALVVLPAVAALAVAAGGAPDKSAPRLPSEPSLSLPFPAAALRSGTFTSSSARRVAEQSWWGGTYTAGTGEQVTVYVSTSYPHDESVAQRWVGFFASLVHGRELSFMRAYVATLREVQEICGGEDVLGCYGGGMLVTVGDTGAGMEPTSVAAHEYGHHVAAHRLNSPWAAIDWGPKRWASDANVCVRAAAGTAYPGDEGLHYSLNPGEAFAEVFRVLNEPGAPLSWPIIDPSFIPDAAALAAARADVLDPWAAPKPAVIVARFRAKRARTWVRRISMPLDGVLSITLDMPADAAYGLTLLADDRHTVLARGLWTATARRALTYTVCGRRAAVLRVTRHGPSGRFRLALTVP